MYAHPKPLISNPKLKRSIPESSAVNTVNQTLNLTLNPKPPGLGHWA